MKKNIKYIFSIFVVIIVAIYLFWINRPTETPTTLIDNDDAANTPTPSTTPVTSYTFTHNLGFGSTGAGVTALQQFLIAQGYLTAVSSPTGYFGPFTETALATFQAKNNISPAAGYLGTQTRTFIENQSGLTSALPASGTPTAASSGYKDGTYTGSVADAVYGQLQVTATISGGKITNVTTPVYPNSPGHSSQVSANALPILEQEAIVSQSANVNIVSGATQDSTAFQESLAVALAQAKN